MSEYLNRLSIDSSIHNANLNFTVNASATPQTGFLDIDIQTSNIKMHAKGHVENGIFTIDSPIDCNIAIPHMQHQYVHVDPCSLSVSINKCIFPINFIIPDISQLKIEGALQNENIEFFFPLNNEKLNIKNLYATLGSSKITEKIYMQST